MGMRIAAPLAARQAGLLLHLTSLPGAADGGLLGPDAWRFADWLARAGFGLWQMLPVTPVGTSGSPYQSQSAFAGNPRLIDTRLLMVGGAADTAGVPDWPQRAELIAADWAAFRRRADPREQAAYRDFVAAEKSWLVPWVLYCCARQQYGEQGWWTWPEALRQREAPALSELLAANTELAGCSAWAQYLFAVQWSALRSHAAGLGLSLFGDLPIYVDLDSADVWWHQELFLLDQAGQPHALAGVPPDYFSADGQLWGNPLYDWAAMAADDYRWWSARIGHELRRFDFVRIDHFRGLEACWSIPADAATAREGHWEQVPGEAMLYRAATEAGRPLPLVAEDLGIITDEVRALRERLGLPGMLVLQFAFDGSPDNPYLPGQHPEQAVLYIGTHDNDTLAGWYFALDEQGRARVAALSGCAGDELPQALLQLACESPARLVVLTLQDLLGLGSEARMNTPGTISGNWQWRFRWEQLSPDMAARWHELLARTGRTGAGSEFIRE